MAFSRFQFRLSTLLWITLAVACWFGGMRYGWLGHKREQQRIIDEIMNEPPSVEILDLSPGQVNNVLINDLPQP